MVDTKDRIEMEHHESIPDGNTDQVEVHRAITYEEEPSTIYKLGWKTFLAITALALANCCAAIVNTVSFLDTSWPFTISPCSDKHHHQIPSQGRWWFRFG